MNFAYSVQKFLFVSFNHPTEMDRSFIVFVSQTVSTKTDILIRTVSF